jgi:hypothetical protein
MDPQAKKSEFIAWAFRGWIPWAAATLAVLAFSLPVFMLLAAHGSYLPFSAETLTFRYFASVRILAGEGGTTWLGQGQLVTLFQNGILAGLQLLTHQDLEHSLQSFSLCSSIVVGLLMYGIDVAVCFDPCLTWTDRALVLVLGPATILGTVHAGFYYTLLPDYYALDFPIITASVYLALRCCRTPRQFRKRDAIMIGVFCGIAASNKVTLLGPTGLVALLILARPPFGFGRLVARTVLAAAACAAAFVLVFAADYRFDGTNAVNAMRASLNFFKDAGTEPNFWETNLQVFLHGYGYNAIIAGWCLTTLFFGEELLRLKCRQGVVLLGANLLVAALLVAGLYKRGAGTTLFEGCSILAGLCALMLAAGLGLRPRGRWTLILPAVIAIGAWSKFDFAHNWSVVTKSHQISQNVWAARNYSLGFAQPVVVVIPDRSYFTGSVEELLQMTFFASGFAPASKALVDRFIPFTSFRTSPGTIQTGSTVVWLEKWDLVAHRPLTESSAAEAVRWAALTRLATINPHRMWRAGYGDAGVIHVMSVRRLN